MTAQKIDHLSFEEALKELEAIVRELEGGQGDLEKAITDYERGSALKEHCTSKLASARMKVEKIIQAQQGVAITEPLDAA